MSEPDPGAGPRRQAPPDDASVSGIPDEDLSANRRRYAIRLIPMIGAAIAGNLAVTVLGILTLVQVVHALLLGELNAELRSMCGRTVTYIRQLYDYMSWQSDEPVFPFAPFPERDETR